MIDLSAVIMQIKRHVIGPDFCKQEFIIAILFIEIGGIKSSFTYLGYRKILYGLGSELDILGFVI